MLVREEIQQLFEDYSFFRSKTAHFQKLKQRMPYLRDLKATPDRLRILAGMATWCGKRDIPPRQWLYSLFASRCWLFAPKLEKSALQSEKHLARFANFGEYGFYKSYIAALDNLKKLNNPELGFDPNKDISTTAEAAKRFYLGRGGSEECQSYMWSETFGYHPKSAICCACPGKQKCLAALSKRLAFDILAVREGRLSVRDARRQALARVTYGH